MKVKLTYDIAQTIRTRAAAGVLHKTLAYEYGVSKATISMIITGKIWKCMDNGLEGSPCLERRQGKKREIAMPPNGTVFATAETPTA